ncbi:MAG: hypothetical protein AB8G18_05635 [Gammaproteobacteria bacterium]
MRFRSRCRQYALPSALLIVFGINVAAADSDSDAAAKLTDTTTSQVKEATVDESEVVTKEASDVEFEGDPNQIICRQSSSSTGSASRIKTRSCKTRAQFRQEDESRLTRADQLLENKKDGWRRLRNNSDKE